MLFGANLSAQIYTPSSMAITNQTQLDSFQIFFPELEIIGGTLLIANDPDLPADHPDQLVDLSPLAQIRRVDGSLIIENTKQLQNLDGLENLDSLGGSLSAVGNKRLKTLAAIEGIVHSGHDVALSRFNFNDSLEYIAYPKGIKRITYELQFIANPRLTALPDLSGLEYVRTLFCSSNGIHDLSGLGGATFIDNLRLRSNTGTAYTAFGDSVYVNTLTVSNHPNLTDASALGTLRSCEELDVQQCSNGLDIYFNTNPQLTELPYFEHLDSVTGSLDITNCDALTELPGLGLDHIHELNINYNSSLLTADVPDLLSADEITITFNENLQHVGPFAQVDSHVGLRVSDNVHLQTIDALHSVDTFTYVNIYACNQLESIHLLKRAQSSKYRGYEFAGIKLGDYGLGYSNQPDLPSLISLTGFDSLQTVSNILISGIGLTDITGFNQLHSLTTYPINGSTSEAGGFLRIAFTESLAQISGFSQLEVIDRYFMFDSNEASVDMNFFPNLNTFGTGDSTNNVMDVRNNPNLEFCELCDRLPVFRGKINLVDNPKLQTFNLFGSVPPGETLPYIHANINTTLTTIGGYPGPRKVTDAWIRNNPALQDLSGWCTAVYESNGSSIASWNFENNADPFNSYDGLLGFCDQLVDTEEPARPTRLSTVHPNPVQGLLSLTLSDPVLVATARYELYHPDGRRYGTALLTGTTTSIDLSELPAGVYTLRVLYADHRAEVHRVVVLPE